MKEIRISEAAALSIVEQADYYEQAADKALALRWEAAVDGTVASLLNFPERGAHCRFRSPALKGLRWIPVLGFPRHLVFYQHLEGDETVLVVQVLYGARDLAALFTPDA